jgi:hypothetical protein
MDDNAVNQARQVLKHSNRWVFLSKLVALGASAGAGADIVGRCLDHLARKLPRETGADTLAVVLHIGDDRYGVSWSRAGGIGPAPEVEPAHEEWADPKCLRGVIKKGALPVGVIEARIETPERQFWTTERHLLYAVAAFLSVVAENLTLQAFVDRQLAILNRRRSHLVRELSLRSLTTEEADELHDLEREIDAYLDATTPLPSQVLKDLDACIDRLGLSPAGLKP